MENPRALWSYCLWDTAAGHRLHYNPRCSGLKSAKQLFPVELCACWGWLSKKEDWPNPNTEVQRYKDADNDLYVCCCSGVCGTEDKDGFKIDKAAAKNMCKSSRNLSAPER